MATPLGLATASRHQHRQSYEAGLADRDGKLIALDGDIGPASQRWQMAISTREQTHADMKNIEGHLNRPSLRWKMGMILFWSLAVIVAVAEASLNQFVIDIVLATPSDVSLALSFALALFMMFIAHMCGKLSRHTWSEFEQSIAYGNAVLAVVGMLAMAGLIAIFTVARAKYGVVSAAPVVADIFSAIKEDVARLGLWATLWSALADTQALMVGAINSTTLFLAFALGYISHDPDRNLDSADKSYERSKSAVARLETKYQAARNAILQRANRALSRHQTRYSAANAAVVAEKKKLGQLLDEDDRFVLSSLDRLLAEGRERLEKKPGNPAPDKPPAPPAGMPNVSRLPRNR